MYTPLGGPIILMFYTELILTILKEKTLISKTAERAGILVKVFCLLNIASTIILMVIVMYPMTNPGFELVYSEFFNWFHFSYILSLGCMAIGTSLLIIYKKHLNKREFLTLLSYSILPTAAVLLELYLSRLALINFSITLVIFIYYASIQRELSQQIKQNELELTENKVSIMLSQIQPHFLYNALSAISTLCDEDPIKAKKAIADFSVYLRGNMESLNKKLISIEKELNHVKGYLELEKAVYEETLNVVYKIEAKDFLLPPLSIQPIVENAVKHGIGKKEDGGLITITVKESEKDYSITVTDDGIGFNPESLNQNNRKQIGLKNVKRRLKEQCNGNLEVLSQTGKGTTVKITIPKLIKN